MTVAPLALVGLIAGAGFPAPLGSRGIDGRRVRPLAAAHPLLVMTAASTVARLTAPPIVIGWSATALCAAAAVLITLMRPRRPA